MDLTVRVSELDPDGVDITTRFRLGYWEEATVNA